MKFNLLIATGLLVLTACSEPARQPNTTAPVEGNVPAATNDPAPAPSYPADYRIDQPIAAADIKTELALIGPPVYRAKDDMLLFDVEVTNDGKVPLVSAGKAPVRLAITLAGPDGVDTAPGTRKFARAMLPLITEGTKGQAKVKVPVEPLLGLTVRAELVQEGIAWFSRAYKQPTLDIGTFQRCNSAAATLCDASGNPIPAL